MPTNNTTPAPKNPIYQALIDELQRRTRRFGFARHRTLGGLYLSMHLHNNEWTLIVHTLSGPPNRTTLDVLRTALKCPDAHWEISGPVAIILCPV